MLGGAARHARMVAEAQRLRCWCWLQGYELFSADLSTFLIQQPDGNLVLYNTALVNSGIGRNGAASLFGSNTYMAGTPPYYLTMQQVMLGVEITLSCYLIQYAAFLNMAATAWLGDAMLLAGAGLQPRAVR